jgi:multiple sugar transport system ATP-binding protein
MAEIVLQNLVKRFGDTVAVNDVSLTIRDREFLVLLGPSGCGKTTTLRSISGLEIPTAGKILIDGEDVTTRRASQRDIAFVFQLYALYPHMSAYENIAFPLRTQGVPRATIRQEVMKAAELLQITHILNRRPKALAGGDQQRVALGRALVRRPKAFLLDEPIGTLDAAFREEMRTELKRLHVDIGATTVYVTHDQMEAMSMGDRIAIMNLGVLQQVGEPHEVYTNPNNLFVAKFIGSPGMNFLECEAVQGVEGGLALRMAADGSRLAIPPALQALLKEQDLRGRTLILGMRPEDVMLGGQARDSQLTGEVFVTERMGSYNIVDVRLGEEIIRARTLPAVRLEIGVQVSVAFDMERVRVFDKQSEQSLTRRQGAGTNG